MSWCLTKAFRAAAAANPCAPAIGLDEDVNAAAEAGWMAPGAELGAGLVAVHIRTAAAACCCNCCFCSALVYDSCTEARRLRSDSGMFLVVDCIVREDLHTGVDRSAIGSHTIQGRLHVWCINCS